MKTKLYYAFIIVVASFIFTTKTYAHETTTLHSHQAQFNIESINTKQIIDATYALVTIYLLFWMTKTSLKKESDNCLCRVSKKN